MHSMQITAAMFGVILAFLAFMSPMAQASDLLFYKSGGCDGDKPDYLTCSNAEVNGLCCFAAFPFTAVLACHDCDHKMLTPYWGTTDCTGYNMGSCTEDDANGIHCCMELGSNATSSAKFFPATKEGTVLDSNGEVSQSSEGCANPKSPDTLTYVDPREPGVVRNIVNMTGEDFTNVMAAYTAEDYETLRKLSL